MKKVQYLVFVLWLSLYSIQINAQFTQQQATNLVLNQILSGELDNVDVYMFDDTLAVEDPVILAYGDTIPLPYSSCWVYFVDDGPFMNWAHPSRFIFVCDSIGSYNISAEDFFPKSWDSAYSLISEVSGPTPIDLPADTNAVIEGLEPDPNNYAVMICQDDEPRFWNDISALYCTLIDVYGYKKENIFVHFVEGNSVYGDDLDGGEQSDDIDYCAYKDTLYHTFKELAGITNTSLEIPELNEGDQLFVCFIGHGNMTSNQEHSYVYLPPDMNSKMYDTTFARYLEGISCSQIIVYMNNCFGGEFETELMDFSNYEVQCKNRSVHTASDNEAAHTEMWITDKAFDEMAFYWTAAARGYYPDDDQPWEVSYPVGDFPFNTIPFDSIHPVDYNPDLNNDGFVQMEEAFDYANNWNTWSETGYFCPFGGVPGGLYGYDDPQDSVNISFADTLLTLTGITGTVKESKTVDDRSYTLCGPLTIDSNTTITLEGGTSIYMINDSAEITVDEYASLVCQDGNTFFTGLTEDNKITIDGSFTPGDSNTFDHISEIILNNPSLQTSFNNVNFTDTTILKNYGDSLSIDSSLFENCLGVYSFASDVNISNTRFINSSIVVSNSEDTSTHTIYVEDSEFDNSNQNTMAAVKLMCCDRFFVDDNDISGYDKGIEAWYSGEGASGNQSIYNNDITDTENGILLYNTIASVAGNNVYENDYGVKFLSRSNVAFMGDPLDGIQYITDNDSYEVYASDDSFPWYFRYNEIVDEDNSGNPNDPLVYHNSEDDSLRDVRYNCWGTNFVDTLDLYPAGGYTWSPDYCSKKSSIYSGPDEELYNLALVYFETGKYDSAQIFYDSLVINYNSSYFSKAALKDMFALEQFTGNHYESLRSWYRTNDSILADSSLRRLADYLANKCDIELGYYQTAFSWYDSVILNPYTFEDSIFAVIDRDFLSLQTGSNALKEITYNLQGIPDSYDEFKLKSDYLISLLPGVRKDEEELNKGMVCASNAMILHIVPNPARDVAEMEYELYSNGHVLLEVYDYSARKLASIDQGFQKEGKHTIKLNLKNYKSGLYLVSLVFNGKLENSMKLSVY